MKRIIFSRLQILFDISGIGPTPTRKLLASPLKARLDVEDSKDAEEREAIPRTAEIVRDVRDIAQTVNLLYSA